MSNRRRPQTCLDDLAALLGDRPIAGGCDDCGAYQTMTKTAPGVFSVTVHHDSSCPALAVMERRRRG